MRLMALGQDIWTIEGDCVNFHGFPYSTRSVVVRLQSGDIWFWSPIKFEEELAQEISALGPLRHLVSPNKLHHLFLGDWCERFPQAKLWGPESTIKKRPDLKFDATLTDQAPLEWVSEFTHFHVRGSFAMDEILFLHNASRTLIIADFSENFSPEFLKANWNPWQQWVAKRWKIIVGHGFAPLDWRMSFLRRARLKSLKADLLSRKIDKVVMAHGVIQQSEGTAYLEKSLSWI